MKGKKVKSKTQKKSNGNPTDDDILYCICRACDSCEEWYHGDCINVSQKQAEFIQSFYCQYCREPKSSAKKEPVSHNSQNTKKKIERKPSNNRRVENRKSVSNSSQLSDVADNEEYDSHSSCTSPSYHRNDSRLQHKYEDEREFKRMKIESSPCGHCNACKRNSDCGTCETCRTFSSKAKRRPPCRMRVCINNKPEYIKSEKRVSRSSLKQENYEDFANSRLVVNDAPKHASGMRLPDVNNRMPYEDRLVNKRGSNQRFTDYEMKKRTLENNKRQRMSKDRAGHHEYMDNSNQSMRRQNSRYLTNQHMLSVKDRLPDRNVLSPDRRLRLAMESHLHLDGYESDDDVVLPEVPHCRAPGCLKHAIHSEFCSAECQMRTTGKVIQKPIIGARPLLKDSSVIPYTLPYPDHLYCKHHRSAAHLDPRVMNGGMEGGIVSLPPHLNHQHHHRQLNNLQQHHHLNHHLSQQSKCLPQVAHHTCYDSVVVEPDEEKMTLDTRSLSRPHHAPTPASVLDMALDDFSLSDHHNQQLSTAQRPTPLLSRSNGDAAVTVQQQQQRKTNLFATAQPTTHDPVYMSPQHRNGVGTEAVARGRLVSGSSLPGIEDGVISPPSQSLLNCHDGSSATATTAVTEADVISRVDPDHVNDADDEEEEDPSSSHALLRDAAADLLGAYSAQPAPPSNTTPTRHAPPQPHEDFYLLSTAAAASDGDSIEINWPASPGTAALVGNTATASSTAGGQT